MRLVVLALLVACAGQSAVDSTARGKGPEDTVPAEALAPGSCDDAQLYTLEELAAGKGDGERVALDVVPQVRGMCTLLACNSECCNNCGGDYAANLRREPEDRDFELRFVGFTGCGGMDCNFHCEPFGRSPTTRYRFVGTSTYKPAGVTSTYHQAGFKVEKVCRL